jgi:hypothetical protein
VDSNTFTTEAATQVVEFRTNALMVLSRVDSRFGSVVDGLIAPIFQTKPNTQWTPMFLSSHFLR